MNKWILVFIVLLIFQSGPSVAQHTCTWDSQNISLNSPVKFQIQDRSHEYHLEGSGIVVDFAAVGGMEGISGLAPSLDSYAASFGYSVNGKSREILDLENLAAARIEGRKEGKSLVLLLLATRDYKRHFTCEILFPESQRRIVEALVKGISCDADFEGSETADGDEADDYQSDDSREPAQENRPDEEGENDRQKAAACDPLPYRRDEDRETGQHHDTNTPPDAGAVTNAHLTGTPVQKLVWQLLSAYSPDGYYILDEFYKAPTAYGGQSNSGDDDFTAWIDGHSEQDVVKALNTVVHEMDHGYTGRLYLKLLRDAVKPAGDGDYSAFYLGHGETRLVHHTGLFLTREIDSIYPKKLVTERYETYVHPSEPDMGSQQNGIYGLLDEWNAYYHGTRTSADLYGYYRERRDDAEGWAGFFTDYYGTYYAYLEFKSYILVYMMYAKKNYPQYFRGFINNEDLLYSLKKTDELWSTLINNFKVMKKNAMAALATKGLRVEEKEGYFFINGTGYGNFSETYTLFQEELKKPAYQEIARTLGFASAGGPDF